MDHQILTTYQVYLKYHQPLQVTVLFQWPLHGPGMHCLRRSEHRRRTWRFVASWKHFYSLRHPLKTGHDCAIYLLHSVNCKFWHNVLYSAPAAFFCNSVTIMLTFIIIIIIIIIISVNCKQTNKHKALTHSTECVTPSSTNVNAGDNVTHLFYLIFYLMSP